MIDLRDYEADTVAIHDFLVSFTGYEEQRHEKCKKYLALIARLAYRTIKSLCVSLDDLKTFNEKIASAIISNTQRYRQMFRNIIYSILINETHLLEEYITNDQILFRFRDSLDLYVEACRRNKDAVIPDELLIRFDLYFKLPSNVEPITIRSVKADKIGKLSLINGIITRTSDVRPMLTLGTYECAKCGTQIYQPITGPTYIPAQKCLGKECQANNKAGQLMFHNRGSKFNKFQEIRIQELSDQVPQGNIPRSLTLWITGENTRHCQPGDQVTVTGTLLPTQRITRGRIVRKGLLTDLIFLVDDIQLMENTNDMAISAFILSEDEKQLLRDGLMYERLALSFAPEIFGHEDLKKALILMLVGGSDENTSQMRIRGNINICMMGDPGVAKSQILSYLCRVSPRSQYTSGKGSSGVGLTAAVMRDQLTGEFILEGGALVLADRGICCIDEFDKMTDVDRASIHEVMEQMTISVAKAGIFTTLNARTSVIAAANPAFGKYNPNKSVEQNIHLPAALLSRFDLLWLLQDKPNIDSDMRIAEHIVNIHGNVQTKTALNLLTIADIKRIVGACKQTKVTIPQDLTQYIISAYVQMREEYRNVQSKKTHQFTSARTLLSILRLASACAKLRLSETMSQADVDEAVRLTEKSRESLDTFKFTSSRNEFHNNPSDQVFMLIRRLSQAVPLETDGAQRVNYQDALEEAMICGFSKKQFEQSLDDYDKLGVISIENNKTLINLI